MAILDQFLATWIKPLVNVSFSTAHSEDDFVQNNGWVMMIGGNGNLRINTIDDYCTLAEFYDVPARTEEGSRAFSELIECRQYEGIFNQHCSLSSLIQSDLVSITTSSESHSRLTDAVHELFEAFVYFQSLVPNNLFSGVVDKVRAVDELKSPYSVMKAFLSELNHLDFLIHRYFPANHPDLNSTLGYHRLIEAYATLKREFHQACYELEVDEEIKCNQFFRIASVHNVPASWSRVLIIDSLEELHAMTLANQRVDGTILYRGQTRGESPQKMISELRKQQMVIWATLKGPYDYRKLLQEDLLKPLQEQVGF